jgi:hypothetical protein
MIGHGNGGHAGLFGLFRESLVTAGAVQQAESGMQVKMNELRHVYSHSMVAGGFDVMSYTTRLMPFTSLTIRVETEFKTSYGNRTQSAVIPSVLCTARIAMV